MAIRARQRATPALGISLAATVLATVVFGAIFAAERDWLSGVFMTVAALASLRLGLLELQLRRQEREPASELDAASQPDGVHADDGVPADRAFVTAAQQRMGLRVRDGFVVIGRDVAGFVPTEEWRSSVAEIGIGLVATRVDLTRTDFSAMESPALAQELVALIEGHDGLLLDESWGWSRQGKWLAQESRKTLLTLDERAPGALAARWPTSTSSPDKQRSIRNRVLMVGSGVVAVLAGVGAVAWQSTGNSDFLIAGISFAVLVAIGLVGGLVAAARMAE